MYFLFEPCHEKTIVLFMTRSDTNQAVQLQKMASGLKFRLMNVEGLYYLCSENKGSDLHLCFAYAKCWFSYDVAHFFI